MEMRFGCWRKLLWASALAGGLLACGNGSAHDDGGQPFTRDAGADAGLGGVILYPDGGIDVPDAGKAAPPPPWRVTTVVFQGDGGNELRQGSGPFLLEIDGTDLSLATSYFVNGLTVSVKSASDTQVVLSGTAAHGMTLGTYDVTLAGNGFSSTLAAAFSAAPVTVATALGASDTDGWGTLAHPFRTLRKGLTLARAGDQIHLGEGTYDDAHGEVWDGVEANPANPSLTANVPAGVTILGVGDNTVLASAIPGGNSSTGLVFGADAGVEDVRLSNFHRALFVLAGAVRLRNVSCAGGMSDCFLLYQGALDTDGCTTQGSQASGLALFGGTATVTNFLSSGNRTGLYVNGAMAAVSGATLTGNGVFGTQLLSGLVAVGAAKVAVSGTTVSNNYGAGVYLIGNPVFTMTGGSVSGTRNPDGGLSAGAVQLLLQSAVTLRGVSIHDNVRAGISGDQLDVSRLTLINDSFSNNVRDVFVDGGTSYAIFARGTTASGSTEVMRLYGAYGLDLGTATDGGYNTLSATGHVLVLDGLSGTRTASASHTSFNGTVPTAATVTGPVNTTGWDLLTSSDHLHLY